MQQISIPKSFFIKEREHLYSSWREAFFREMFQNSLDAGSSRIDINIEEGLVEFIDNGHGMSDDTINNVFFALGETSKSGENSVGGFGRARILTCFAMNSYKFWSNHSFCNGDGAMYSVETVSDFQIGCKFRINVGADESVFKMREALYAVLQRSQLDCKVFINGIQFKDWMRKNRHVKDDSFGSIYVNKSKDSGGSVVVRVKGLWMFDIRTSAKPQIVIEIDIKKSREILTVNRDGMHWAYQNSLQEFLEALAVDKRSALRENRRKTRLILGTGVHTSINSKQVKEFPVENFEVVSMRPIGGGIAAAVASSSVVDREVIDGKMFETNLPTIYLNDQTDPFDDSHKKVRRVIDQYDPMNWTFFTKKRSSNSDGEETFRKGGAKLKLLIVWEACCREAIRAYMVCRDEEYVKWIVGWTFDLDALACHEMLVQGNALCLNPVSADGKMRYKVRDKRDQKVLMALAKHEVAHIMYSYHNEDFSSLHTDIDMAFDESSCSRLIRESLKSV